MYSRKRTEVPYLIFSHSFEDIRKYEESTTNSFLYSIYALGKMHDESIITMDWLVDNVVGSIPAISDLTEEAQKEAKIQGLSKTQVPEKGVG